MTDAGGLDVVVVTYRSREAVGRSIPAAQQIPDLRKLVVVDNGDDQTGEYARGLGADVVELPNNPGFGAGQNAGMRRGSAPFALLLNPDAEPDVGGVMAGLAYLDRHPDVGAVQGAIINRRTGMPERSQGIELTSIHLFGRALQLNSLRRLRAVRLIAGRVAHLRDHINRIPESPTDVETLAATALLVRRAAFDQVGGFDERYFLYGEDLDLCRRLRGAGWRLIALPCRWALHTSGESSPSSFEREWVWWRGTLQFAASWWTGAAWAVAVMASVIEAVKLSAMHPAEARRSWSGIVVWGMKQRRPPLGSSALGRDSR